MTAERRRARRLLWLGVAAILAAAIGPWLWRAWADRAAIEADRRIAREKAYEIACLEAVIARGLPPGGDADAEIARCRAEAAGAR